MSKLAVAIAANASHALSVWQADALAQPVDRTVATGDAALDAQLPGGGWPVGALSEILQPQTGLAEWRLLLPALARTQGPVVLVGAPYQPFGPALAAQGLQPSRLLCVQASNAAGRLWARRAGAALCRCHGRAGLAAAGPARATAPAADGRRRARQAAVRDAAPASAAGVVAGRAARGAGAAGRQRRVEPAHRQAARAAAHAGVDAAGTRGGAGGAAGGGAAARDVRGQAGGAAHGLSKA